MHCELKWLFECEDCGGSFNIIPELEEDIVYCPQCGGGNLRTTFTPICHETEDKLDENC